MILFRSDSQGSIKLSHPRLRRFPLRKVLGDLSLRDCVEMVELPAGLRVGGNLDLDWCGGLVRLPTGLHVEDNLYLYECGVQHIPADLVVWGDMYLQGFLYNRVPSTAKIGGEILRYVTRDDFV